MKILNKRPDLKQLTIKHYEHKQAIKAKLVDGFKCAMMFIGLTILGSIIFFGGFYIVNRLKNSADNSLSRIYSDMTEVNQREIYLKDVEFNNDEESQKLFKLLKQYQDNPSKQLANKIKQDIDFNKVGFKVKNYDYSDKTSISNFTQIESIKFAKTKVPLIVVDYTTTGNRHDVLSNKAMLILPE